MDPDKLMITRMDQEDKNLTDTVTLVLKMVQRMTRKMKRVQRMEQVQPEDTLKMQVANRFSRSK